MKYHTAGVLEKALSYLIFILFVLPIAALIFVLCGLFQLCRARPVVRLFSRGCQRLGVRLMRGGLQHLYLGLLIQRVRFDFLPCRVGLEYAAYVEATGTARGFVCFNGLYVGGYDDCRAIIMDPQRRRGLTLGSSILATPRSFDPCMPTFFDTGSKYHTAWRRCFDDEIAGRDALSTALINNAALFRSRRSRLSTRGSRRPSRTRSPPSPRACSDRALPLRRHQPGRRARGRLVAAVVAFRRSDARHARHRSCPRGHTTSRCAV